ncbi:glycosyltransferase family 4 protein [Croceitalea rosinachiae]|uniref:Glycosyltransferase family 4 protein n=1 Tax=Croceitalea rosinachiae TaxID=3075596 RepID=A0ABU3A8W1_9FLAO|nr:glycosyltransferase family 4 protein [Croceitalea sp. F388]MDT0606245.1 glycosyltransferase family 4 protein [Croceitalea sp. F388]
MFPSDNDPLFGIFVKNFRLELEKQEVDFSRSVLIRGKTKSPLKKLFKYLVHYLKIIQIFFGFKYDLIYLHYLTHHIPILLPLIMLKRRPLVINVHGSDIIGLKNQKLLNIAAKIILLRIDLLVVPTIYFKEKVLSLYPFISKNRVFVSPSGGVDLQKFHTLPLKKDRDRTLTLGFVSRLTEDKGWRIFLNSILILKRDKIKIKAIIVGKGESENEILSKIKKDNLKKEIDFLGFVPQNELINIYNSIDLYIFPTYREAESLGLTGIEAMACGTPVIASNIAGPSTYIRHNVNGFLFPPKDSEALVKEIKKYIDMSQEERLRICQSALKTAQEYSQSTVANNLKKKLEYLVKADISS